MFILSFVGCCAGWCNYILIIIEWPVCRLPAGRFFLFCTLILLRKSVDIDLNSIHIPVMVNEIVDGLQLRSGGNWLDGTVGDGGHSRIILEHTGPGGYLVGFDKDLQGLKTAEQVLDSYRGRFKLIQGSYANMMEKLADENVGSVSGVLLDLGISSRQVELPGYGFSFNKSEDLDMRFDKSETLTAMHVVNEYPYEILCQIFREYGEERYSKRIARRIVSDRPLRTTSDLADLVKQCIPGSVNRNPATRVFQALRIEVNGELDDLKVGLVGALSLLEKNGRMAVISYHSLEDRIVKNFMRDNSQFCECSKNIPVCVCDLEPELRLINRKVITPSKEEIDGNRRSRSARLRIAEKIV